MEKNSIEKMISENIMPVAVVSGMPYKTQFNAIKYPVRGEVNNLPSKTVPDLSMSVKELIYRYTHGLSLGEGKTPVYDSESEIQMPPDWDKLDISEKREWLSEKTAEYEEIQDRLRRQNAELLEKQRQKEVDEAVERKLKAIREIKNPERYQSEMFNDEQPK